MINPRDVIYTLTFPNHFYYVLVYLFVAKNFNLLKCVTSCMEE